MNILYNYRTSLIKIIKNYKTSKNTSPITYEDKIHPNKVGHKNK